MEGKRCSKCGVVKPLEDYQRHKSKADGRRSQCRECTNEANRAWRLANKGRVREASRAWREANRERSRELSRAWAEANVEHLRAYREANRERKREYDHAYREANADRRREASRAWREANPGYQRAWQQANPDKVATNTHRWRARKAHAVPQRWTVDHTLGDPLACWWCGRGLLGATVHTDHVMPISLGGPADPTNEVMSCGSCNSRKQAKHFLVWIAELVS